MAMMRRLRRTAIVLLIVALALTVLSVTPWGSRVIGAGRLLADMGMTGMSPSGLQANGRDIAASRGVMRSSLTVDYAGRTYEADIYTVSGEPLASLVLVPGLAPRGREDPRLVDLAVA